MKKLFILIIAVWIHSIQISAQNTDLPNFTPPSPEASAITQYGNLEINESTGRANATVPIYNYMAGQLTLPISLDYIGNGVKVNDLATWTGVNWTLKAGGVITRTVYQNPDELVYERIFPTDIAAISNITNPIGDATILNSYFAGTSSQYDSQPDIFNFSFGDYSGSFYLDEENMAPVLITKDTDIEIFIEGFPGDSNRDNLYNHHQFRISTPDGVDYFFGGEVVEETEMEQDWHSKVTPRAITSYYLTHIVHPIKGNIFLEYLLPVNYKISVYQHRALRKYGRHPKLVSDSDLPSATCLQNLGYNDGDIIFTKVGETPTNSNSTIVYNNIYNGRFLSRIFSTDHNMEMLFHSTPITDGSFNSERRLNSIEVKKGNNKYLDVDLTYEDDYDNNVLQRFFLKKVEFDKPSISSSLNVPHEFEAYSFEYNDPTGLPARFSSSQDALGFFNGENNPNGLLPSFNLQNIPGGYRNDIEHIAGSFPFTADRSTHFEFKSKGTLSKMYYPTGGYTQFEYESPLGRELGFQNHFVRVFRNDYPLEGGNGATHIDDMANSIFIGMPMFVEPDQPIISNELLASQNITLKIKAESVYQTYHYPDGIVITIYKHVNGNWVQQEQLAPIYMPNQGGMNPIYQYETTRTRYFLKDEDYKIELSLHNNPMGSPMTASLQMEFSTGYNIIEGEGLRVKRTSDYPANGSDTNNIKRYYYMGKEDVLLDPIDNPSIVNYVKPQFYKPTKFIVRENFLITDPSDGGCIVNGLAASSTVLSPSNCYIFDIYPTNNFYKQSVLSDYDRVTISYGGDAFENGGVEKIFKRDTGHFIMESQNNTELIDDKIDEKLMTHYSASWMRRKHGKLTKQITLKRKGDTIYKIQELDRSYLNNSHAIQNVSLGLVHQNFSPGPLFLFRDSWLGEYNIVSIDNSLQQSVKKEFIDPIPVFWYNGSTHQANPYVFPGWHYQDHDSDGILNFEDPDYLALMDNGYLIDDNDYAQIVTTSTLDYNSYPGQPTRIVNSSSRENESLITVNYYVDQTQNLSDLEPQDINNYDQLISEHRVDTPIHTESWIVKNEIEELLSSQRILYEPKNGDLLPSIIKTSKGTNSLEERIVFVSYSAGMPSEVKYANGSITRYVYNNNNQVTRKIENFTGFEPAPPIGNSDCENIQLSYTGQPLVTIYEYDSVSHLLTKVTDPTCNVIYYDYDDFKRLEYIKDRNGNILQKYEYNFRPQNQN